MFLNCRICVENGNRNGEFLKFSNFKRQFKMSRGLFDIRTREEPSNADHSTHFEALSIPNQIFSNFVCAIAKKLDKWQLEELFEVKNYQFSKISSKFEQTLKLLEIKFEIIKMFFFYYFQTSFKLDNFSSFKYSSQICNRNFYVAWQSFDTWLAIRCSTERRTQVF